MEKIKSFENIVYDELDQVWKTYLIKKHIIKEWQTRKERSPKIIHIYDPERLYKHLRNNINSNPLMQFIFDTLGLKWKRYYPIYKRKNWRWFRIKSFQEWSWETYYNTSERYRDYENNEVNKAVDIIAWWYPPIVTRLFCERPVDEKWNDVFTLLIKQRYANKIGG